MGDRSTGESGDRLGDEGRDFLPPEPAGPEPDLGGRPSGAPAGAATPSPGATRADRAAPGWQESSAGVWPHGGPTGQQAGWQPPGQPPGPAGWPSPGQPWGHAAPEPDNNPAVAGFVLSMVALGLLVLSAGLSSIVSVACAALGIFYARRGRARVDAGQTGKHRGLAQAGFVSGIVGLALALVATAFWALILVLALTDENFGDDFDDGGFDSISAVARAAAVGARLGAWVLT